MYCTRQPDLLSVELNMILFYFVTKNTVKQAKNGEKHGQIHLINKNKQTNLARNITKGASALCKAIQNKAIISMPGADQ